VKYYIIAGEASGDLHGSNLIKAIFQKDAQAKIRCWGGNLMEEAGATLVKHYQKLAFMGFWEVLLNLRTILKNLDFCKKDILQFQPDRVVYIDYPGFNLRIARWAYQMGFENHYYISPQVWAWKENRVAQMKKHLTALYVILPFEKAYFEQQHHYKTHFVGHPLQDVLKTLQRDDAFLERHELPKDKPIIALLPGSRKQEIQKMLPLFLKVLPYFPHHQFIIAGAPGLKKGVYEPFLTTKKIKIVFNETYLVLQKAQAAIVTSGTATLQTALLGVPQMVCYKTSFLNYFIGKQFVRLKYISLVNLILNKRAVIELIQQQCTVNTIRETLEEILSAKGQQKIKQDYQQLETLVGPSGASEKVAALLLES